MMVFDVTNEESFKNLDFWLDEIQKYLFLSNKETDRLIVKKYWSEIKSTYQERGQSVNKELKSMPKKMVLTTFKYQHAIHKILISYFKLQSKTFLLADKTYKITFKERKNQVLILKIHQTIRSAKRDNKIAVVEKYMSKAHFQII